MPNPGERPVKTRHTHSPRVPSVGQGRRNVARRRPSCRRPSRQLLRRRRRLRALQSARPRRSGEPQCADVDRASLLEGVPGRRAHGLSGRGGRRLRDHDDVLVRCWVLGADPELYRARRTAGVPPADVRASRPHGAHARRLRVSRRAAVQFLRSAPESGEDLRDPNTLFREAVLSAGAER